MMQYNVIADDDDLIKLSVGVDHEQEGRLYMPSLEFLEIKDEKDFSLFWDNDHFLFNDLPAFLQRYLDRKLEQGDEVRFGDIWHILSEDKAGELLEMINLALKLGWYERKEVLQTDNGDSREQQ